MVGGNKIYLIDAMTADKKWTQKKWYARFENVLGTCYNLETAKKFAREYFEKNMNDVLAIKCKYLNTKFIIK